MIDKLRWGVDRWKIMQHPQEEFYRIRQQIQYRIIDKWWYAHVPLCKNFTYDATLSVKEFYSREGISEIIRNTAGDVRKFKLLNVIIENIIVNEKWNYDFKNRKDGQQTFVHQIDDFNYNQGEVKYVYELSRLYHFPVLAAYAIGTSNNDLLKTLERQLRAWFIQNPFLGSVAWKSGNVVGIRAINLIIYRHLLALMGDCANMDVFLSPLIGFHYRFIRSHLSLYSSKGNHHIGELAGLIAISSSYKFPGSNKILKSSFQKLESEILRLIHKDGFNKEQATRYQASYINLIAASVYLAGLKGLELSVQAKERFRKMYLLLDAFRISKNEYFRVGDDDNAELIYPYFDDEYNVYESALNDASVLFDVEPKSDYHFDLRNYLLWGDSGLAVYKNKRKNSVKNLQCKLYAESGYFMVKDERISMLFDVGSIGLLPTMSHGHSDLLNLILYIDGQPVLVDCGSYQYNVYYKKFRDYFHGVHSHNTLSVEHLDQAIPSSGMFWMSNPTVEVKHYSEDPQHPICVASHNGYERNELHVVHTRKVNYDKQKNQIVMTDYISSNGKKHLFFYLHFDPHADVKHRGDTLIINNKVQIYNSLFVSGELIKGNPDLPLGWYSEQYDSIEPTWTFVLCTSVEKTMELETCIKF